MATQTIAHLKSIEDRWIMATLAGYSIGLPHDVMQGVHPLFCNTDLPAEFQEHRLFDANGEIVCGIVYVKANRSIQQQLGWSCYSLGLTQESLEVALRILKGRKPQSKQKRVFKTKEEAALHWIETH